MKTLRRLLKPLAFLFSLSVVGFVAADQNYIGPGGAAGFTGGTVAGATTFSALVTAGAGINVTGAATITGAVRAGNGLASAPGYQFTSGAATMGLFGASSTIMAYATGSALALGFPAVSLVPTVGTMAAETQASLRETTHSVTWTNAQVVALGATTAGDISVVTLPAKTAIKNFYVIITGTAAGVTTLTVACGRTGAAYIDYIVASDAKAATNTVYGDASGERGTNLTGYDLPSYTGTTVLNCHFISTVQNLDQTTGSTGRVVFQTEVIP